MTPCLKNACRNESEARADHEAIGDLAKQMFADHYSRVGISRPAFEDISPIEQEWWRDRAADRIGTGIK